MESIARFAIALNPFKGECAKWRYYTAVRAPATIIGCSILGSRKLLATG